MARYRSITPSERDRNASNEEHEAQLRECQTVNRNHWETPAVMIASLLVGVAFAIAHDRFYYYYDGRAVKSGLEQKVIVDVGTAFAFLVKMFFCISAATVFSQQLFQSLRQRAESIDHIDALFDIFGNALHFGKITLWLRHFVLAVVALVVWCIPIAAIFTPGTIHVQPDLKYENNTLLKAVQPQQSWVGKQNFGQTQIDYTALTGYGGHTFADAVLNGPSGTLYSVALGSVSLRDILPIPPPKQNSSYELSFFAPALSCNNLSAGELSNFEKSISAAQKAKYLPGQDTILGGVETVYNSTSLVVKYNAWIESHRGIDLSNPSWNNGTNDQTSPDEANNQYFYFSSNVNSLLLACHLHNATYNAGFTFQDSEQTINLKSVTLHELVPLNSTVDTTTPDYSNSVYNAIYYAFNNIVIATAINDTGSTSPNILSYGPGLVLVSALRDFIEDSSPLTTSTVITTLQSMFQNITLSTLSAPSLRLSDAQTSPIRTTTWRTVNVYVYDPQDLYIAYGCALLAAMLCVVWGLFLVLCRNKASYSLKFSTIVRTTRRREIDGIVDAGARMGEEPLPREMRQVKLGYSADDGFAVVHIGGRNGEETKGYGHERSATDSTFLPEIPIVERIASGRDGQQVRRKPLPGAETREYRSIGGHGTAN